MRFWVVILSVVCLVACQSEQSKFIQSEFSKIQARWLVDSFIMGGSTVSDAITKKFKTGEILFKQCKYDEKEFAKGGRGCGGDFDINGFIYGISYTYNYGNGYYTMSLSGPVGSRDETVVNLMYGEWTLNTIDNKLIAKQVKNYSKPDILISFTATHK